MENLAPPYMFNLIFAKCEYVCVEGGWGSTVDFSRHSARRRTAINLLYVLGACVSPVLRDSYAA